MELRRRLLVTYLDEERQKKKIPRDFLAEPSVPFSGGFSKGTSRNFMNSPHSLLRNSKLELVHVFVGFRGELKRKPPFLEGQSG